jgi:serine/threonine protein kinase
VSDVGTLENGAPYMVMEFLHGQDLSALIRDRGPVPFPDAVDFVLQACEALAEAHALGIVHRDLKPANLFMITGADGAPCIKVLDFGISKLTKGDSSGDYGMTSTQAVMGSPLYMSPEQMTSSRDVDGRSDIWAMGTILFELLTGRPPFLGDTMPQLCGMILQEPPPMPRGFRPDLPEGLQVVILRCLEKKRDARYANVAELASALAPFGTRLAARSAERVSKVLSAAGISSRELDLTVPASVAAATGSAWGTTQAKTSHRALWVTLGGVGVVLVAGAALFLRPGHVDAPDPRTSASAAPMSERVAPAPTPPPPAIAPAPVAALTSVPAPSEASPAVADASVTPPPKSVSSKTSARPRPTTAKSVAEKAPAPAKSVAPPPAARAAVDPLEGRR